MSIIEVVFSTALFSIMTYTILSSMVLTRVIFNQNIEGLEKQGNLRRAMMVINRDLREAQQGQDVGACDDNNPAGVCIQSSPPVLSFKVPEATVGNQTSYKTVKFTFDSTNQTVVRDEIPSTGPPSSTSEVVGRKITNISFVQNQDEAILITLNSGDQALAAKVFLRNQS